MRYIDKLDQAYNDVENDELAQHQATSSKIKIPDIDISKEAYKSAKDVAKVVGTDRVYKAKLNYYHEWKWLDGSWDHDSGNAAVFLYAKDKDDAESRIALLLKVKGPYYSMEGSIEEVPKSTAEAEIANRSGVYHEFKELASHILTLPTPTMYDEMEKSINWAVNMLKKLKDQDEANKRAAWLQTPDGKAWLAKYEADKALLDKLEKQRDDAQAKAQAKRDQQAQNEDDVIDILRKDSKKYPQYKDGIAPVVVEGGRKFKGKGFAISWEDCSGNDNYVPMITASGRIAHDYAYYHRDDEWTNAIIYDPVSKKIQKANIKFCRVDTSVSNEQCVAAFKQYCEDKVASTIEWCKSKDPRKSEFELKSWAKNIIKKYYPWIDIDKYITFDQKDLDNAASNKVASTVDWAISLGKGQAETERIIMRALAKKGLDYKNFEALISMKLQLRFGKKPKAMAF